MCYASDVHCCRAGVLDDLQAAVDEIVKGNDLPVSIIIVGIGAADFVKMDVLVSIQLFKTTSLFCLIFYFAQWVSQDADDDPLRSTWGEVARRDIVQFVPFRNFKDKVSFHLYINGERARERERERERKKCVCAVFLEGTDSVYGVGLVGVCERGA